MLPQNSYIASIWRQFPAKYQPMVAENSRELLVLGEYDRMRLSPAQGWRDIIRLPDFGDLRGFTTSLPLIPLEGQNDSAERMASEFSRHSLADGSSIESLLVLVQFQLSPAFFMSSDVSKRFIADEQFAWQKLLLVALSEWKKECSLELSCGYFCLSSVDLVVAVSVNSAAELKLVNDSAAALTHRRISHLVEAYTANQEDPPQPGHAFLSVRPTVVMSPDFKVDGDIWSGEVEIESVFTAECGHADAVTQKLRMAVPGISCTTSNGGLNVATKFDGIDTWLRAWSLIAADLDWFQGNILDVESRLMCSLPAEGGDHPKGEWGHSVDLSAKLDRVEAQINSAKSCLGAVAHHALLEVLNSFKHSFRSVQLIASCADLLPFFVELGSQCHAIASQKLIVSNTSLRFSDIVSHLRKAIRNRTEHRTARRSEGLLVGPEQSHLKLLTSSSYLIHACWGLLRSCVNGRWSKPEELPDTSVCLSIGRAGYVQSVEPLLQLGEELRRRGVPVGRALVVESAGTQFTNPAFTPMHYLHELSEASSLMSLTGFAKERKQINSWLADCVQARLADSILRAWKHTRGALSEENQEEYLRRANQVARGYVLLMLTRNSELANFSEPSLTRAYYEVASSTEPTGFAKILVNILKDSENNTTNFHNVMTAANDDSSFRGTRLSVDMNEAAPGFDNAYVTLTHSVVRHEAAVFSYQLVTDLVPDVLADFFTLNAAYALVPEINHRTLYFNKLLTACIDAYGEFSEAVHGVVARWAVFHFAAGESADEQLAFRRHVAEATNEKLADKIFEEIQKHPLTRTDNVNALLTGGWALPTESARIETERALIRGLLMTGDEIDGECLSRMYECALPPLYHSMLDRHGP